jgi:hypothetical protein
MHGQQAARERRRAIWSIALTGLSIPFLTAMFLQGPQWPVFVFSLAFMAGYIVERLRLSRTMVALINQLEALPRSAGQPTAG